MLMHQIEENEMSDVLLRLLVNLTNPTLLLYREELPKDGPNRRNYLQLIEILQGYKSAYSLQPIWAALEKRLQKVLGIVSNVRYKRIHSIVATGIGKHLNQIKLKQHNLAQQILNLLICYVFYASNM